MYLEDMHSVLNCHNLAKDAKFFLGWLWFSVASTVMQGVSDRPLQWYSKCYCVVSVTKTFTLKGIQTIHCLTP
jgi:hypothetical protein